ncbi:general transcription factor II-I repeat domain-containing protein 2A-like [Diorhabda carinulata]|uniref:general transcription factor II-I repeat domain-containing protein 2A-like n=1 Tax=Diorhabda carinulata TaxID=1163345 RepID=UPI0025A21C0B|nr:general transcription factor II-I repeat domain-containing protein 2A-like [Diorhabda carinulata]
MFSDSESDIPFEVRETANAAVGSSITEKLRSIYALANQKFEEWFNLKNIKNINEKVLIAYSENLKTLKAATLWTTHSMLRSELTVRKNVNIKYTILLVGMKRRLALDESTDIRDIPQLAVFIRFVSPNFVVKEELLDLVALQETTRGVDIKNALDSIMKNLDVTLDKLVSIATDGAPVMLGKNVGLIGLLRDDSQIPQFIPIHCIFHRKHLVVKYLKYPDIMKTVLHIVNYIRTNAKNHRQFKNFLEELKDEELPNDIYFFCIVRWLSSYNVLNRFVDLFDPITAFLKEKEITYSELDNDEWLQVLMFFTDNVGVNVDGGEAPFKETNTFEKQYRCLKSNNSEVQKRRTII